MALTLSTLRNVRRSLVVVLFVLYALWASLAAWEIIEHTQASTTAIEKILETYNLKNESEAALQRYDKEHPFFGFLLGSPVQHEMNLPDPGQANEALYGEVKHLLKTVRLQAGVAAWWSWALLNISLAYIVSLAALERSFARRPVLFSLTCVSLCFFVIGILAPAMVIWTSPSIPLASGPLEFVVQHQVRGIWAIIKELFTSRHWMIGGFLFLFSIVTPMTKALLTFVVTFSHNKNLNYRVGQFLHTIGKWSMADVFVAGILLSLYALKFQQATKSVPCLGLYYFIGYCIFSLTTTEFLVHSHLADRDGEHETELRLNRWGIGIMFAVVLAFLVGSYFYTYQQYTMNTRDNVRSTGSPNKLDNSDLVLPVHHSGSH